ncbi:hypothetical protein PGB28_08015 [Primorskyibacter aestuariivivens]|uniref:hypothetical protein n=1 Tax=Primorskyibacter aestuariivivens TaxID=1888912 RepID=UPI0023006D2F|nr:hypothetical protein [Primorskyibacter aestuariivivens]MDA7428401.1 hypothetical protein [Primorskyibacter aestuariivivens]
MRRFGFFRHCAPLAMILLASGLHGQQTITMDDLEPDRTGDNSLERCLLDPEDCAPRTGGGAPPAPPPPAEPVPEPALPDWKEQSFDFGLISPPAGEMAEAKVRVLTLDFSFDKGSARPDAAGIAEMILLGDALQGDPYPAHRYVFVGHSTPDEGPEGRGLSFRRAALLADFVSRFVGLEQYRYQVAGLVAAVPLIKDAPNDKRNRRVEVILAPL